MGLHSSPMLKTSGFLLHTHMKLTVEKTVRNTFDFDYERKRIQKAFRYRKDKKNREMLNKLLDLIEAGKWAKAAKTLESTWWRGYDKNVHCRRLEFVGGLYRRPTNNLSEPMIFEYSASWIDLINAFCYYPKNFKVIKDKEE